MPQWCQCWCTGVSHGAWQRSSNQRYKPTNESAKERVKGVNRLDRVRNVGIRERLNQGVLDLVKRRQESWKGRLKEMSTEKTSNICWRDGGMSMDQNVLWLNESSVEICSNSYCSSTLICSNEPPQVQKSRYFRNGPLEMLTYMPLGYESTLPTSWSISAMRVI